jgi:transposase-like protein
MIAVQCDLPGVFRTTLDVRRCLSGTQNGERDAEEPSHREQMVKILRETDRPPVVDVAKKHGVSEQTIYAWRKRSTGCFILRKRRGRLEPRPQPPVAR